MSSSASFNPRDRYRLPATVASRPAWPFNLRSRLGHYYRAWCSAGEVYVARARWHQPPFDLTTRLTTTGHTSRPTLYEEPRNDRLRALWAYTAGGGAYQVLWSYSDDDAASWSPAVILFSDGKYPLPAEDPHTGAVLLLAYVSGYLQGRLQYPGEATPRAAVTLTVGGSPLAVADDTFGVVWMGDGAGRIILTARKLGETTVREWRSFDEVGLTFAEVP